MGAKGIKLISEQVQRGHTGQAAGSARKKAKRVNKRAVLRERATAAGVSVAVIRMRDQRELDDIRNRPWTSSYKCKDPVPERRRGFW